jgi:hypothetical protein
MRAIRAVPAGRAGPHKRPSVNKGAKTPSCFVSSPTSTEELRNHGIAADPEASHPQMGFLVREAAERSPELLRLKRRT